MALLILLQYTKSFLLFLLVLFLIRSAGQSQGLELDLLPGKPELGDLLLLLGHLELTQLALDSFPGLELLAGHLRDGRLLPSRADFTEVHVMAVGAAGLV